MTTGSHGTELPTPPLFFYLLTVHISIRCMWQSSTLITFGGGVISLHEHL